MTARRRPRRAAFARRQRGIVLFIALIVMVVMTLAAVALLRSMDTTNQAIGNLAFRQASILPATMAVEAAAASLFKDANNGGAMVADVRADDAARNYYATYARKDNSIGVPQPLQKLADAQALSVQLKDEAGNQITYVIERMCDAASATKPGDGSATLSWCDMMPPKQSPGTTVNDPALIQFPPQPFYRVTVRVDGPKNTTSFLQAVLR